MRSLAGFAWAPLGRLRYIPPATPLLAAKRYWFTESQAYEPMRVRVGWWNCRTFSGDTGPEEVEYVFFTRRSTRYAAQHAVRAPRAGARPRALTGRGHPFPSPPARLPRRAGGAVFTSSTGERP